MGKSEKKMEMRGISKFFPGVKALDNVNFNIQSSKVHALVGENGAGKTTLMNILGGVFSPDNGNIFINGKEIDINSPHKSQEIGISFIHQELSLVQELNVSQNIFLGREISKGFLNSGIMVKKAEKILKRLALDIDVKKLVKNLNAGEQQLVEIARALSIEAWVIIMDEPTSALSEDEKHQLFGFIKQLKRQGIAIIYITHHMPEIFEIADEVTVLRDGKHIGTFYIKDVDEANVVKMMIGRDVERFFDRKRTNPGKVILEVKKLTKAGKFNDVSFIIREGEVVGLYGLRGAGSTEIARCIFGLDRYDKGEIFLDGKKPNIKSPLDGIKAGVGFVPEDRHEEGIIELMTVKENLSQPLLPWINNFGWIKKKEESNIAEKSVSSLGIKVTSTDQVVNTLSGGNQQKVSLGKWLAKDSKLLILDEPTKGIDVGAKIEIYKIIEGLARSGKSILIISSELPEIIGISDRIFVLYRGEIDRCYRYEEVTEEKLLLSASGVTDKKGIKG